MNIQNHVVQWEPSIVLITDIDNTLYDFVDFYARAFRSMVHLLSYDLGIPEDSLIEDFGRIFRDRGSVDQDYLIESLSAVRNMPRDEVSKLAARGRRAFDLTREKHLRAYSNIPDVIRILSEGGVRIFAVTNAPYFYALKRMKSIGVLQYCYGLVAWEGPAPLHDEAAKKYNKIRDRAARQTSLLSNIRQEHEQAKRICLRGSS